jgi:hypothetical protein
VEPKLAPHTAAQLLPGKTVIGAWHGAGVRAECP